MLIDVPVFISFNADNADQAYRHGPNKVFGRTITLRYDTAQGGDPKVQFCNEYPPTGKLAFHDDTDGIFHFIMPSRADSLIADLAEQYPEDYWVDQDAAKIAADSIGQGRAA